MISSSADGRSDHPEPSGVDDHGLRDLVDSGRRAAAASIRRREHWLRAQAAATGTFDGVLLDLAERGRPVTIPTRHGRRLRGTVRSLGHDFVRLDLAADGSTLVPIAAITAIRAEPGTPPSSGDRAGALDARLADVLTDLAADRPPVVVHLAGGGTFGGLLVAVGRDLVILEVGASGDRAYLALDAMGDLVLG